MTDLIAFQWALRPAAPARPWLHCPGCAMTRPFQSTGRIRLNANGRLLDAWLIYRCCHCPQRWNRPIFARQDRRSLARKLVDDCEASAPDFVARIESDIESLRRHSTRIESAGRPTVLKTVLCAPRPDQAELGLRIVGGRAAAVRLDRLLTDELALSRSRLAALVGAGHLRLLGAQSHAFRRATNGDVTLLVTLAGMAAQDRQAILAGLGPATA